MAAHKRKKNSAPRIGRPSQFTDENQKVIIKTVGLGCSYVDACRCARISYETFRGWMAEGRRDIEARKASAFAAFFGDIKKAESDLKSKALEGIQLAATTTWTAWAWIMERKFPDEWSLQRGEIRQLTRITEEQAKQIADLKAALGQAKQDTTSPEKESGPDVPAEAAPKAD
jgi:hypothetical protein